MHKNSSKISSLFVILLLIILPLQSSQASNVFSLKESATESLLNLAGPETEDTSFGKLTMIVEPLTANIEVVDREDGVDFIVSQTKTYAAWRFTYEVENTSESEMMRNIVVKDSFGAELDIIDYSIVYSNPGNPGNVDIWTQGNMNKYFFNWNSFELGPGEWASISIVVGLGTNPAGKQEYTSCGIYELNSEGTLWYQTNKPGHSEDKGSSYTVEVPCKSCIEICFSASKIEWYVRKPGEFFVKALEGSVTASHPVVITFAGFENVTNGSNIDIISVFYDLNTAQPGNWITPEELNNTQITLNTDHNTVGFNMWQRLSLGGQSAGLYSDQGVITFTVRNMEIGVP